MIPPIKRAVGDFTVGRAIFFATRPWHLRGQFPAVSRNPIEVRRQVVAKYRSLLPPLPGY
jgi:hypothetical protein